MRVIIFGRDASRSRDASRAHATSARGNRSEAEAAVGMADGARKRIGRVRARRGLQSKESLHHFLDLLLPGVALSDDRLLDLERRVLRHGDRKSTRLNSSHRCISYAV